MNSLKTVWFQFGFVEFIHRVKMIQLAGTLMECQVYASAVPLPLDEESDLDMYAAQGT